MCSAAAVGFGRKYDLIYTSVRFPDDWLNYTLILFSLLFSYAVWVRFVRRFGVWEKWHKGSKYHWH